MVEKMGPLVHLSVLSPWRGNRQGPFAGAHCSPGLRRIATDGIVRL